MKTLLLLRHGKSSWDDTSLADFDRPLARRGVKAAKRMGREMARRGWLPQRAVVSSAVRTRETWHLVAAELPVAAEFEANPRLYDATSTQLLDVIQQTTETVRTLVVVGHNPGLEDLAHGLAGDDSDRAALDTVAAKFPTAALARFEFDGSWRALRFGGARLSHFLRPRDLW